ncbi:2-oxoglutarate dehydrogenase complex dihydrolipoyllysine-residue succinyltransferase [Pseudochelatococcus sp. B33]
MATEIRVPTLGESVTEATVGQWFKKVGDAVKADEPLVELETDKVTLEVNAPADGVLAEVTVKEGETVEVGALLGTFNAGGAGAAAAPAAPKAEAAPAPAPAPAAPAAAPAAPAAAPAKAADLDHGPAVQRIATETGINPASVPATGKDGRVTKGDILAFSQAPAPAPAPAPTLRAPVAPADEAREERVRMTKLRQTIARRLKEAQANAAMLTTFNDVDMTNVMDLRNQYKDVFEKKHGVKLGFMGFFVKATVQALKDVPAVNAELDGTELIFKNYYHIGVAVGTEKGLVVPVVRDADQLSVAGIEKQIADFGRRARDGQLKIEEMQGGTFTISNGGVYGSLLSTPILNAPQSGILGMHRIEQRPVVHKGQIVARPMMYLAVSYDHRVIDGKEAVTFLVRIKENLEDPARLVLDL